MLRSTRPIFRTPSAFLLLIALSATLLFPACTAKGPAAPAVPADLTKHPVYSKYDFGDGSKVINFATQPLAAPAGTVGEAMAHDLTLKRDLDRLGFTIRFHPFLKGSDLNFFMDRGKIDVAIAGDMPTLLMAAKSAIRVVGVTSIGYGAVVLKNGTLVQDLKGKRIGNAPGSSAHFTILEALRRSGMRESDLTLVPMDVDDMIDALSRGEIDGFSAWEPAPSAAVQKVPGTRKIFRMTSSSYVYFSRSFAEKNPEAARRITASMIRSVRWMRADFRNLLTASGWTVAAEEALRSGEHQSSIEQIASVTKENLLNLSGVPLIPPNHLRAEGDLQNKFLFLKSKGMIPATDSWETVLSCFDTELARSLLSSPAEHRLDTFRFSPDTP